ncbi:MAG: alpha-L-rhamnosidase C-terminal domain-containing protein [Ferruginibacter sp.]|nr:alpha-L-rhamnosidase C-terminal domain-containing protein [Ferruginibacter sp.]
MKNVFTALLSIACILLTNTGDAQTAKDAMSERPWNAEWIAAPHDEGLSFGVYYFRKNIELPAKPASFVIHVSADNRYKLYVNGVMVSLGPAFHDLHNWNYETVDIARYLTTGKNNVAALVWNEAQFRQEAQVSIRTGFVVQGNSLAEEILNTNKTWKCYLDKGYQPVPGYFFAASKGELVIVNEVVKSDWKTIDFNDSTWPAANKIMDARIKGTAWGLDWPLVASPLPAREMTYQRIPLLRSAAGMKVNNAFPATKTAVTIPANSTVSLLLDQTFLTNAYVTLDFSGGKDAGISLGYAESMFEAGSNERKGNRDEVEGKHFIGRIDSIVADGTPGNSFTTRSFRSFRYIKLFVKTQQEPLVIDDLYGTFTGYPFPQAAQFTTDNVEIKQMLDIGWRTARLNAWETYTDCPYYEQLQYIGDTRIQAMVSYYYSGDDRLARNALTQIDQSRLPEGITKSCYPTKGTQVISPFSLWYIGMLYDYWMYRGDDAFVKEKLTGARGVLDFFSKYQLPDGSLKKTPYWAFVDWSGNMGGDLGGGSAAIYDLQLLWAYQWAAAMETRIGVNDFAVLYTQKSKQLKATIQRKYWDPVKKLYADTEAKKGYSQHVNSLAILTGLLQPADMQAVVNGLLNDKSLTQATIYFKYYLHQALVKAGRGNDYLQWLDIWRENIKMGLTTWAEYSDVQTSRSDCHAWGSSPNVEFFRTVLGIDSDAPGFKKVKIEPHLGDSKNAGGEIPHPAGKVAVKYQLNNGTWQMNIDLPANTPGRFIWKGITYQLKAGANRLVI